MSLHTSTVVWKFSQAKHANRLLLLAIADYADDTGYAYPSVKSLGEKCQLCERQVQTGLRELQQAGELVISIGTGRNRCNEYQITLAERYELKPTATVGASQQLQNRVQNVRGANHAGVQNVRSEGADCAGEGADCAVKGGKVCTQTVIEQPIEQPIEQSGIAEGDTATDETLDLSIGDVPATESKIPPSKKPTAEKPKRESLAGTLLPTDWTPTPHLLEWASNKYPTMDVADQTEQFCRHFWAKSGTNALKRDWGMTWQTWIDRSAKQYGTAPTPKTLFNAAPPTPSMPTRPGGRVSMEEARANLERGKREIAERYAATGRI